MNQQLPANELQEPESEDPILKAKHALAVQLDNSIPDIWSASELAEAIDQLIKANLSERK